MRKRITSLLLTLAMLLSLVPAMGVTASAAGTEIEAVSFSYTGYAEGENVANAVVTCNTAGVDFTYKWQYSDSGGSYSDATKLSAQFISGIKYTLWIYFKAQDGLALAGLNETDVTLGDNNPGVVYTNYTIDEVKYSYGVPFSMSPLGGVTKYIVGFYTQGGKIGEESYRVERVTGTDGKLAAEQVPTPTKEHYTFDGWYTAASGGTLLSLDTVYTASRNEYYARWTENPALTGIATITGTAKFGQTLTASLESGNNTGTLSYQWKRNGTDITSATGNTYTLVEEDIDKTITVAISSSVESGTIVSSPTAAVEKADGPAAPSVTPVACTNSSNNDGKITGVNTTMEYSTASDFSTKTTCTGSEITGLANGTYYVRVAETTTHKAGAAATVSVSAYTPIPGAGAGVAVTGKVKSYNPNNATTIQLMQGGKEQYKTTIVKATGSGQVTQDFSFNAVAPGTYDLVVTKDAHLTYTVKGVVVGDSPLDLTKHSNAAISTITLLCGDIDGNGFINSTDLGIILKGQNYGKSTATAGDKAADLDGNGFINSTDLGIVLQGQHYGKSAVSVNFAG